MCACVFHRTAILSEVNSSKWIYRDRERGREREKEKKVHLKRSLLEQNLILQQQSKLLPAAARQHFHTKYFNQTILKTIAVISVQ